MANTQIIPEHYEKRINQFKRDSTRLALMEKIKSLVTIAPQKMQIAFDRTNKDLSNFDNVVKTEIEEPFKSLIDKYKEMLTDYENEKYSDIIGDGK